MKIRKKTESEDGEHKIQFDEVWNNRKWVNKEQESKNRHNISPTASNKSDPRGSKDVNDKDMENFSDGEENKYKRDKILKIW